MMMHSEEFKQEAVRIALTSGLAPSPISDWLYLAVILDLHSRWVADWAVSDRMIRRAKTWQSGHWS